MHDLVVRNQDDALTAAVVAMCSNNPVDAIVSFFEEIRLPDECGARLLFAALGLWSSGFQSGLRRSAMLR